MRTIEIANAAAPLARLVREARGGALVVTRRGRPIAAVVPLGSAEWEDFLVGQHPRFREILARSDASYRAHGAIPLQDVERELAIPARRARRRRAARPIRSAARSR